MARKSSTARSRSEDDEDARPKKRPKNRFERGDSPDFDPSVYDVTDSEIGEDVRSWAEEARSKVEDFALAILEEEDDVDFSATLQQLEVMERTGAVRRFSYGVLRVSLQKKLDTAEYRLRKHKLVRIVEIRDEKEAADERVPSIDDRKGMIAAEHYTEQLELRVIDLKYKLGLLMEAIISLSERNKMIPGIQGQRRGQQEAQSAGGTDARKAKQSRERE